VNAPESFVEKLESQFRGRLRVRFSQERKAWHIEQRVRRGLFPGFKPTKSRSGKVKWDESVDRYVQARDGVVLIMEVATGTNTDCPVCKKPLKVPYYTTSVVTCLFCKLQGKQSHTPLVYFPLNDDLLAYLRKIDPENPASARLAEDQDRANEALEREQDARAWLATEAAFEDDYRRVAGIPYAHLSGRTSFWKGK
jgi:hypothetical protein